MILLLVGWDNERTPRALVEDLQVFPYLPVDLKYASRLNTILHKLQ